MTLRRVAEEMSQRLAGLPDVSRAYVVGGRPRVVRILVDPDRMAAYHVSPLELERAVRAADVRQTAGDFRRHDRLVQVEAGKPFTNARQIRELVVGAFDGRPASLTDVASVEDGPDEVTSYVRHGWGPARGFTKEEFFPGTVLGRRNNERNAPRLRSRGEIAEPLSPATAVAGRLDELPSQPAVTIAIAKKRGSNAVWVANSVLREAEKLRAAIVIVVALLTFGLGWREALIVAVAVPVVFGLTLAVNLMLGFTINRVTLFALILSLGLLVDDPIVDVENIVRHFALRKRATRRIVLEAVSEIRPPLITATLAVIVSFLPMFFITGMMGPYMRPMALNVPVTMLVSMLVAFTITPWLAYHVLLRKYSEGSQAGQSPNLQVRLPPSPFFFRPPRP